MNSNTLKYGENVMVLARLVTGWYHDLDNGRNFLKYNMEITCKIYTDNERTIAYAFMVKFNPTLRDMVGILSNEKFFNMVATLIQVNLTAIVYSKGL